MEFLDKEDYYEIYLESMLASYDRDILTLLYQPIIGANALALFNTLWSGFSLQDVSSLSTHQRLFKLMNISLNEFFIARQKLEAVGLLRTYFRKDKNISYYQYVLFAPKTPDQFFNDILLKGFLIQAMGEKEVFRLNARFQNKTRKEETLFVDVTAKFPDVFSIDENDHSFKNEIKGEKRKRVTKNIVDGFDISGFLKVVKENYGIGQEGFEKAELEEISRLSLLFGIDESVFAGLIIDAYDFNKKPHLDLEKLYYLVKKEHSYSQILNTKQNGDELYNEQTMIGRKLNKMTTTSPFEYLKEYQNGVTPSPSDVNLLNVLSQRYGLNGGVINVLVTYVLEKYDNQLPAPLVEKIAASLVRSKITNASDALSYLNKTRQKKTTNTKEVKETKNKITKSSYDDKTEEELVEEIKKMWG